MSVSGKKFSSCEEGPLIEGSEDEEKMVLSNNGQFATKQVASL